jgi:hypothetical protein
MLTQPLLGQDVYDVLIPCVQDGRRERRRELGTDFVLQEIARWRSLGRLEVPRSVMVELNDALGRTAGEVNDGGQIERAPVSATSEVHATLHEVMWGGSKAFSRRGGEGAADEPVAWGESVLGALGLALEEARSANISYAGGTHLLLGLIGESGGAAATLLGKNGINSAALVERLRSDPLWARAASPHTPVVEQLTMMGGLERATPWVLRWAPALLRRGTVKRSRYRSPVMHCLEYEMARQAVRMASRSVTSAHAVLAISSLRDQLSATGRGLPPGAPRSTWRSMFSLLTEISSRRSRQFPLPRMRSRRCYRRRPQLSSGCPECDGVVG